MRNLRYMVIFPLMVVLLSVVCGIRCYVQAKSEMVEDLNNALRCSAVADVCAENVLDSLTTIQGSPMLTFNGKHGGMVNFLRIPSLRDTAHISYTIAQSHTMEEGMRFPVADICSDTITIIRRRTDGSDVVLEVRAFANPSMTSIVGYSGMGWPLSSFVLGLVMLSLMFIGTKGSPLVQKSDVLQNGNYGTLDNACLASCRENLTLTPMQDKLMKLFYMNPQRTLTKEEICSALWPKKDNPDDSLYTFISRMKSCLAKQSSLRIGNRRGREYFLIDEKEEKS